MKAVRNLPIIGPNTCTTALHKSGANNVFWVRTNYDLEVERLVRLADSLGLKRFALAYPNDPFGQAVLASFRASLASRGIEAVGTHKVSPLFEEARSRFWIGWSRHA